MAVEHRGKPNGGFVILVCVAPVLIWRAAPGWLVGAAAAAQVTAIVWLVAGNLAVRYRTLLVGLAVGAMTTVALWLSLPARSVGIALGAVCHAAAYGCLLTWFATSLRQGHEPVVTEFARRMRRTMPSKVIRYTRRVTVAWCVFFAAQLAVSAALLLAAPVSIWSSFITLWNLPLVVAMGLAEFGCRWLLFRREPRTGLVATLVGLRHIGGLPGGGR